MRFSWTGETSFPAVFFVPASGKFLKKGKGKGRKKGSKEGWEGKKGVRNDGRETGMERERLEKYELTNKDKLNK